MKDRYIDIDQAISVARNSFPDADLFCCTETADLFIFGKDPTMADSCSIVVDRSTGECMLKHFRELLGKERLSVTYLKKSGY